MDTAIAHGFLLLAQNLWNKGEKPNFKEYHNWGGWTPVHKAARNGYIDTLKWIFAEDVLPQCVLDIKNHNGRTPLDVAIEEGKLEVAKFLFEKGGRPNLEINKMRTPVHWAAYCGYTAVLKWALENNVLPLSTLNVKEHDSKWTPLDCIIEYGRLEMMQYLWEMGGRPNLDIYRDGNFTPVHQAARYGKTTNLKWVFENKVLPWSVLHIKDKGKKTPLDWAIINRQWETAVFIQCFFIDLVFLAMQRAKRDHRCVLRRLPNELLDMVVEEVAVRFDLKVVW